MNGIKRFLIIILLINNFSFCATPIEELHTNILNLTQKLNLLSIQLEKTSKTEGTISLTPSQIYKKTFPFVWSPPAQLPQVNYTQSEAHDSVPKIKELIDGYLGSGEIPKDLETKTKLYKDYKPLHGSLQKYKTLIDKAYEKEQEFKNTHYVLYHGMPRIFRLSADLDAAFYNIINKPHQLPSDFIFLRPYNKEAFKLSSLQPWLNQKIKQYGTFDNYAPDIQPYLLSVNLSYFGNITRPRSFTFRYFVGSFTAEPPPIGKVFNIILTPFNLEVERKAFFIGILAELYKTIAIEPINDLLQIFIPRDLIDSYIYPSKPKGIPWDTLIDDIHNGFDTTLNRYIKISPILDVFQNNPEKIADIIDSIEGRFLLQGDFIRNPKSGMKMFRYTPLKENVEQQYLKRLNTIAQFIYKESQAK